MSRKKKIKMFAHADRDSNYDIGESLGLKGEALHYFSYALTEVGFECEVDLKTGECTILTCNGGKVLPCQ